MKKELLKQLGVSSVLLGLSLTASNVGALTRNFFCKLNLVRVRGAAVWILFGISLLTEAWAQSITPVYGANGGLYLDGAIAQVDETTVPGFFVTAACSALNWTLNVAVWEDTGSQLVNTGSYNPGTSCGSTSIATLFNTSSQGYTTVVTATAGYNGVLSVAVWQVGPGGSIAPLGTPATVSGDVAAVDITAIGGGSGSGFPMVVTSALFYNSRALTRQVTTWNVPASGNITQLHSVSQSPFYFNETAITHLNETQAVTADLVNVAGDLAVGAWAIDSAGNVTEKGVAIIGVASEPVIAPYFQGGNPAVITGFVNGSGDQELITWGVSSTGDVTRGSTLNKGATTTAPAITYIPGPLLTFADVLGGNDVLDGMVFEQSGSSIDEIASYHTSWVYYPALPQGAAPLSNNKVATLSLSSSGCDQKGDCPLELEVWSYTN